MLSVFLWCDTKMTPAVQEGVSLLNDCMLCVYAYVCVFVCMGWCVCVCVRVCVCVCVSGI